MDKKLRKKLTKWNIDLVRNLFEKENCILKTTKYIDNMQKLEYICSNGHKCFIILSSWLQGHRCKECFLERRRHKISFLKKSFEEEKWNLKTTKYTNSRQKLRCVCPNGHECQISWNDWQQGNRCKICAIEACRTNIQFIKNEFERRKCVLLTTEYRHSEQILEYICPHGERKEITWHSFKRGGGCLCSCERWNYKGGVCKLNIPLYDTYADQISYAEEIRRDPENSDWLQVKCAYCGKWYTSRIDLVRARIRVLKGARSGESRFYCSEHCKIACPIYYQKLWPKDFKHATSREVDPNLRQMVLERDNWTCQICGKTVDEAEIHCHHMDPAAQNPMFQNDMDSCIALCKDCHGWVHTQYGCRYVDLRCKID